MCRTDEIPRSEANVLKPRSGAEENGKRSSQSIAGKRACIIGEVQVGALRNGALQALAKVSDRTPILSTCESTSTCNFNRPPATPREATWQVVPRVVKRLRVQPRPMVSSDLIRTNAGTSGQALRTSHSSMGRSAVAS